MAKAATAKTTTSKLIQPPKVEYDPLHNITAFELAIIIKLQGKAMNRETATALGSGLRHFKVLEDKDEVLKGLVHRRLD